MAMVRVGPRLRGIGGERQLWLRGRTDHASFGGSSGSSGRYYQGSGAGGGALELKADGDLTIAQGASLAPMVVTDGRMVINGITEVEDQAEPFD